MANSRAAARYAKAILSLASNKNIAEAVHNDMQLISKTISNSEALSQALKNAVITSENKKKVLTQIFTKLNPVTNQLFTVLAQNKRVDLVQQVANKYQQLYNEMQQKQVAIVTTAVPLTPELEAKVLAKVKTLTSKEVLIENKINPDIIGGFILRVGDKQYNASIANKFNNLKREFTLN